MSGRKTKPFTLAWGHPLEARCDRGCSDRGDGVCYFCGWRLGAPRPDADDEVDMELDREEGRAPVYNSYLARLNHQEVRPEDMRQPSGPHWSELVRPGRQVIVGLMREGY